MPTCPLFFPCALDEDADAILCYYFVCFPERTVSADLPVVPSLLLNNACVFIVMLLPPIIVLTFTSPTCHISQISQPRAPTVMYDGKSKNLGSYGGNGVKSGTYYDDDSSS